MPSKGFRTHNNCQQPTIPKKHPPSHSFDVSQTRQRWGMFNIMATAELEIYKVVLYIENWGPAVIRILTPFGGISSYFYVIFKLFVEWTKNILCVCYSSIVDSMMGYFRLHIHIWEKDFSLEAFKCRAVNSSLILLEIHFIILRTYSVYSTRTNDTPLNWIRIGFYSKQGRKQKFLIKYVSGILVALWYLLKTFPWKISTAFNR